MQVHTLLEPLQNGLAGQSSMVHGEAGTQCRGKLGPHFAAFPVADSLLLLMDHFFRHHDWPPLLQAAGRPVDFCISSCAFVRAEMKVITACRFRAEDRR